MLEGCVRGLAVPADNGMVPAQAPVNIIEPVSAPLLCVNARLTPQSNAGSLPPVHVPAMLGPTVTVIEGADTVWSWPSVMLSSTVAPVWECDGWGGRLKLPVAKVPL